MSMWILPLFQLAVGLSVGVYGSVRFFSLEGSRFLLLTIIGGIITANAVIAIITLS